MHVKKSDKIRIDIQFKDGSKSDLTFTHNGTPLTDSNQDGIEITFANDIATLTIANAEEKHSGNISSLRDSATNYKTTNPELSHKISKKLLFVLIWHSVLEWI